jgi:hypothetical protein
MFKHLMLAVVVLVTSISAVWAQDAQPFCMRVSSKVDFGDRWKGWSPLAHWAYIDGFVDGQSGTFLKMSQGLPSAKYEELSKATFVFYNTDVLEKVLTDLYQDPANTFIVFSSMIYIARDKLSGLDVEPKLRRARQTDCATTDPKQFK